MSQRDTFSIDKLFARPIKLEKLINTNCIVVFDTNVLLHAYRWKKITLNEINEVLNHLHESGRLYFSAQVLQEFSKNRISVIAETIEKISNEINRIKSIESPKKPRTLSPIIEEGDFSKEYNKVRENFNQNKINLINRLNDLMNSATNLIYKDPFFEQIKEYSEDYIIKVYDEDYISKTNNESNERTKFGIPPGFKDVKKPSNIAGDYFIWKDLISLNQNVIFVSSDVKNDWVIKDNNNKILSPLPQLTQEFYEKTEGKNFVFSTPIEFIATWNPDIDTKVLKDMKSTNREEITEKLREVGLSYYPGSVTEAVFKIGPVKVMRMSDDKLKGKLTQILANEFKFNKNSENILPEETTNRIKKVLDEYYDHENDTVTDKVVLTAKKTAAEYIQSYISKET